MDKYTIERNIKFKVSGRFESETQAIRSAKEQYGKTFGSECITSFTTGDVFTSIEESNWKVAQLEHILTHDEFLDKLKDLGCVELFANHYYCESKNKYFFVTSHKAYTWSSDDMNIETICFES